MLGSLTMHCQKTAVVVVLAWAEPFGCGVGYSVGLCWSGFSPLYTDVAQYRHSKDPLHAIFVHLL